MLHPGPAAKCSNLLLDRQSQPAPNCQARVRFEAVFFIFRRSDLDHESPVSGDARGVLAIQV